MQSSVVEYSQNKSHVEVGRNIKIAIEKTLKINTFRDLICEHKYIETTENFYISSTDENKKDVSNVFDSLMSSETISNIIKYEIAY